MGRGQAVLDGYCFERREQGIAIAAEQPASRARGERNRDLELGVIAAPGPLPRIRPAMIEHIFALAMGFEIGRRRRGNLTRAFDQNRQLRPAGPRPDAARPF